MGAIYQAEDTRLEGRLCAIKEVASEPGASPARHEQIQAQFYREASILARLDHPNLPKVSDYFLEGGRDYLVMDYVPGRDLRELLEEARSQGQFLSQEQVLAWADQLCDALAYLHTQNPPVLHRDVKPANIKLTPAGTIKLVDFGLVKLLAPEDDRTVTILQGRGTVQYTPLEQYGSETGHTDARSDIYSLGATLYHLLTAHAPVEAKQRFLNPHSMPAVRVLNPDVSPNVAQAIADAMAMHPDDRPASVTEFRAQLHGQPPTGTRLSQRSTGWAVEAGHPAGVYRAAGNLTWRDALRRNRLLLVLLGVLLALAVIVTALPAGRSAPSPRPTVDTASQTGYRTPLSPAGIA
jgi:serine/threonine-protein kinase